MRGCAGDALHSAMRGIGSSQRGGSTVRCGEDPCTWGARGNRPPGGLGVGPVTLQSLKA